MRFFVFPHIISLFIFRGHLIQTQIHYSIVIMTWATTIVSTRMRSRRVNRKFWVDGALHVSVLAAFTVLTIFHLRPIWRLASGVAGGVEDAWMNVFHLWWMRYAFIHFLWPFHSPYIHYPIGADLYWHTLAPAKHIWGIVLLPWLSPIAAYNLLIIFSFVASGYTTWLLCRYLCLKITKIPLISNLAALIGACIFVFSPYHLSQAWGHMNLLSIEGIPLFILFYLRYIENGRFFDRWLAALSALYIILCDYYYFVYILLFIFFDLLFSAIVGRSVSSLFVTKEVRVRRNILVFLSSLICVSPVLVMLLWHAFPAPLSPYHGNSDFFANLAGFFLPSPSSFFFTILPGALQDFSRQKLPYYFEDSGLYLGYFAILFTLIAFMKRLPDTCRFCFIGCIFLLFSLGTFLSVAGDSDLRIWVVCGLFSIGFFLCFSFYRLSWLRDLALILFTIGILDFIIPFTIESKIASIKIPLPYLFFKNIFPFYNRGGYPMRFVLMTYLMLSMCSSMALAWMAQKKIWTLGKIEILFTAFICLNAEYMTVPIPMRPPPIRPMSIIEKIKGEQKNIAVLTDDSVFSEWEVTLHEHPITAARLSRLPISELKEFQRPLFDVLNRGMDPKSVDASSVQDMKTYIQKNYFKYYISHGRNVAREKFIVDVLGGKELWVQEDFQVFQLFE